MTATISMLMLAQAQGGANPLATLVFPLALRSLIDGGLVSADKGAQTMALREHFGALFAVAVALGLFSAARFYTVSWLGERVTADLRNAVSLAGRMVHYAITA